MNAKFNSRKGHVFTLDVVISIVILIIGLAVLFYTFPFKNENYYFTERLSEDLIGVLGNSYTTDFCINPGYLPVSESGSCSCPRYIEMEQIICSPYLFSKNADLLSVITETIQTDHAKKEDIEKMINQLFVQNKVLDSKRFGFALIYTTPNSSIPYELYNTDFDSTLVN